MIKLDFRSEKTWVNMFCQNKIENIQIKNQSLESKKINNKKKYFLYSKTFNFIIN